MLNLVAEELPDPFYYVLDDISSVMHCETPNHSVFRYNFLIRLNPAHVINSLLFTRIIPKLLKISIFLNFSLQK